ncbi:cytochrome P450 [Rhizodiscina lignyota]|uniref:Cytochrome P450 n=1 Tax=Rhizodiscina lignyota TaxID=1504668 RepID=A0A9P4I420_9PEZI|nr:cytochrome P450 [Rhizodiscina lignyota]
MQFSVSISSISIPVFLFVYALVAVLKHLETKKTDAREPPVVASPIPYVGHIIGMLLRGSRYLKSLGSRCPNLPIFTLPMLNGRTYIVTSPALAAQVQRASKALSFNPVIPEVVNRVLGLDAGTMKIIRSGVESEDERGFVGDTQDMLYARLAPGESLDELTAAAGNEFLAQLTDYKEILNANGGKKTEELLGWVKQLVTVATARFLYGPENPLAIQPELEPLFWDFDAGIPGLLLNVYPSITASKAYRGREALVKAFTNYLTAGKKSTGSALTQTRGVIADKHGLDVESTARCEVSFLFAGITNTAVTSYWLILHIFANPTLLKRIRKELELTLKAPSEKSSVRMMNIKTITKDCKLLVSTFRETLRLYSDNASTRVVTTDTVLADQYFLKKGSILQIAGGIMHSDSTIWGGDAGQFNPERFLEDSTKQKSVHPAAFRGFGGGATLCPGRHFALNEILAFVAVVVLLFDVSSVDDEELPIPKKKDDVLAIHILEPLEQVHVQIRRREGWDQCSLQLETS